MAPNTAYNAPENHISEQRHAHTLAEGQDQSADYQHQAYPKVIEHEEGKEPVIVTSAEEEKEWKDRKAAAEAVQAQEASDSSELPSALGENGQGLNSFISLFVSQTDFENFRTALEGRIAALESQIAALIMPTTVVPMTEDSAT